MKHTLTAADVHSWVKSEEFSTQIHTHYLKNEITKRAKIYCIEQGMTLAEFVCLAIAEKLQREVGYAKAKK